MNRNTSQRSVRDTRDQKGVWGTRKGHPYQFHKIHGWTSAWGSRCAGICYLRKELEEGYIHKTVGYTTPDEEIDLDYCKEPYEEDFTYALSNSLGFGGHNSSILLKKYQ